MKRRLLAAAFAAVIAILAALAAVLSGTAGTRTAYPVPQPTISDFQFIKATTPTEAPLLQASAGAMR